MQIRVILIVFVFSVFSLPLAAQENPPPAEIKEDPISIFSSKLGDEDVEFLMQGAWRANVSFSTGLRFGPDAAVLFPFGFPSFGEGFFFEQVPELTFSVWFAERFFAQVSVLARAEDNTILLGYRGLPGEFVQNVLMGNTETGIGNYDFIDLPAQSKSSLGASALFTPGFSKHELLLRYDSTREEKKVFVGANEVSEQKLSPGSLAKGKYFMLPDTAVENLSVYLEDKNGTIVGGDNKRFRQANVNEIYQDTANGFLFILIEHTGRIAVHYTTTTGTVGDPGMGIGALPPNDGTYILPDVTPGIDFNWGVTWLGDNMALRQLSINSQTCLLLWETGKFSPFEMLSAYDLGTPAPEDISTVRIKLIPKGSPESTYTPSPPWGWSVSFKAEPRRRYFTAFVDSDRRGNFRNHYPFPDDIHQLYGPTLDHIPPFFEYEIFAEMPTGMTTYTLETNVVPGSIRVKRNGIEETRFIYDENSYTLTFTTPIYPYDRIEVYYRVSVAEKNAGDILFAWGNRFPFSPMASLDLALGLRWNILPGAYTQKAYDKTGALVFSASLSGASEIFSYKLSGALSYSNPDTTGIMRLAGMEGQGLVIEPGEDLSTPSAAPAGVAGLGDRGRLLYKDYRQYDAFGGFELMSETWSLPAGQVWSYSTGSKPGPYLVAGSSESSRGQSLVMDFELAAVGDWVGIQIPFSYQNGVADLSLIRSVIASLKAIDVGVGDDFDVYIQIGACKEDIDEDGILDEEYSTLAGGYTFNDADNMAALKVGGGPKNEGNGVINSEDIDGNGTLDAEDTNLVFNYTGAYSRNFNADSGWMYYTIPLTGIDQNTLKRVRAIRIIVVANAANVSARLLVDKIVLSGCSFWSAIDPPATFSTFNVREVEENYLSVTPLQNVFPEARDIFHSGGETQQVLAIEWSGGASSPQWTVKTSLAGSEGIQYRRLVFYAYRDAWAAGDITFSIKDIAQKGATCTIPYTGLSAGAWQKISLDLVEKQISVNDVLITPTSLTVDPDYGSLTFFSLSVANSSDGIFLIDEIHLRDPDGRIGAAAVLTTTLSLKGTQVSLGDVPVFSDISLREDILARTGGFSTLYARPQDEGSIRSITAAKAGIFFVDLAVDVMADSVSDQWSFSGGHTLTVPRFGSPVVFVDRYALQSRSRGTEFSRENSLTLSFPALVRISLSQTAWSRETLLTQDWRGSLALDALSPYQLSIRTNFVQSSSDFYRQDSWYLESWARSFEYYLPWTNPFERRFVTDMEQNLATLPVGVRLVWHSGYTSYEITQTTHRQKDEVSLVLSFPLKIGPVTLEPGYSKSLSALDTVNEEGSLGRDLAWHFLQYETHSYFFTSVPFYEIISPDFNPDFIARTATLEQTSYKPEFSLNLSRQFGSSILDLVVPSKIVFSYGKEYIMQDLLFNAFERLSFSVLFNSINVFGSKGTYRLLRLYAIDSFATSFKTVFSWREDRRLESSSFSIESAYSFEGEKGDKLMIRNLFSVENSDNFIVSDKGGIDFIWQIFPEGGVSLPLVPEKAGKKGFIAHKEGIEFEFFNLMDARSAHPVNVVLKHETSLQFPDFGYLRGEIALGTDWESTPEQSTRKDIVITGIRLTIELSVKF